jgi:NAD(P)-dependent dehydrogenase (short-subunit alcohol dehydrogenase family)
MIATNLTASIQLARAVVPHLRDQGGGRLLQLSSMGGHIAFPAFSMYHATKWGIEGFYESLAAEVEPFGIRTTLVEPGMIRSTFYEAAARVPVSPPYRGTPADRAPTAWSRLPWPPGWPGSRRSGSRPPPPTSTAGRRRADT